MHELIQNKSRSDQKTEQTPTEVDCLNSNNLLSCVNCQYSKWAAWTTKTSHPHCEKPTGGRTQGGWSIGRAEKVVQKVQSDLFSHLRVQKKRKWGFHYRRSSCIQGHDESWSRNWKQMLSPSVSLLLDPTHTPTLSPLQRSPNTGHGLLYGNFQAPAELQATPLQDDQAVRKREAETQISDTPDPNIRKRWQGEEVQACLSTRHSWKASWAQDDFTASPVSHLGETCFPHICLPDRTLSAGRRRIHRTNTCNNQGKQKRLL